jgi:hypothetical protein
MREPVDGGSMVPCSTGVRSKFWIRDQVGRSLESDCRTRVGIGWPTSFGKQETLPHSAAGREWSWVIWVARFLILRRIAPASPTKPTPSKLSVPGSGTAMLVLPLEIVVEPLKKPLPVLIAS